MSTRENSRVTVNSTLTVVSSTPVKQGKSHPLSVLDHAMGQHSLHVIFYYKNNPCGSSFDLDLLRLSLSEVLSEYPVVTGRLARDGDGNWVVKYNDAGVRALRAQVGTTLDEWLRSADGDEERDLTVWEAMPEDPHVWSPFRIQINEFEGGGIAIGLSCSHMHADASSATLLFKSWTDLHRCQATSHPPFLNPAALCGRCSPPITATTSTNYMAAKSKAKPPSLGKMTTATFKFSHSIIRKYLSQIHNGSPNANPFDLLAALFWIRLAILKDNPPTQDNSRSLSICTDIRKLLSAPLPSGYFGNALHFSLLSLDAGELDISRLGHVADLVHEHVAGVGEEEFWSVINWFESQRGEDGKLAPAFRMYGPELTCVNMEEMMVPRGAQSGSCGSFMYNAMFEEDAKPVHVAYHVGNVGGEGLILIMPSPEEGLGRTVMVTLPEEQMAFLRKDDAILRMEPTMLVSGRS